PSYMFFYARLRPPRSPLFPYATLFRSEPAAPAEEAPVAGQEAAAPVEAVEPEEFPEPAGTPEAGEQAEPASPALPADAGATVQDAPVIAAVYRDPAGRFELGLGPEWIP